MVAVAVVEVVEEAVEVAEGCGRANPEASQAGLGSQ